MCMLSRFLCEDTALGSTFKLLSRRAIVPVACHVCSRLALLELPWYVLFSLAPPQQLPIACGQQGQSLRCW